MLNFDAAIFDLDGVVTQTALLHATAWKEMFDDYLHSRARKYHEKFREFTQAVDYAMHVDGRPRYKGVEAFLKSRGIELPPGRPSDGAGEETICGLGNRKNEFFNRRLEADGIQVFESTISLIREMLARGIKVGLATSSRNSTRVLDKAGIAGLFQTRVDGAVSAELGLQGKPEPDIFTTASRNLGVEPRRAIVIEDAVSGVQAGVKGDFGLVIGVAREGNERELQASGADLVVSDLSALTVDQINQLTGLKVGQRPAGDPADKKK
ncbi:MAG: beta-phosphoglucomutase family hydrolase [Verrucomicrobiota bacterium]|jgi:beta-phosphoglucomutase family hydrolase